MYYVYIDESGDLGWNFSQPYGQGGSSKFFVISYVLCHKRSKKKINQFVKSICAELNQPIEIELKGSALRKPERQTFCKKYVEFINRCPDIISGYAIIHKQNVDQHLRENPNILYNYILGRAILKQIKNLDKVILFPDKREIKVKEASSCFDYFKTKLYFDMNSKVVLDFKPLDSQSCYSLWLADWIANTAWRKLERGYTDSFKDIVHISDKVTPPFRFKLTP